jgi:hypothetical protein
MLLLYHYPCAEKFSKRLNGPKAKDKAAKNKYDTKGKESREEISDVELGNNMRQVKRQRNSYAEYENHRECTTSVTGTVTCVPPFASEDPKFKSDPAPEANRKNNGIR